MAVIATRHDELKQVVQRIDGVSTLPSVAAKIINTVRDPRSSAKDLMRVVGSDPSLSARVLRTVNSAAHGLSVPITNLHHAITYLGFRQVRNLALTASVSRIFQGGDEIGPYSRLGLWRHMVSVAIGARMVACRLGFSEFEDAFLAGLMHDIGIILADQHVHPRFEQVIGQLQVGTPLCETEHAVFGFDHQALGERVAQTWKFPSLLLASIGRHHRSHLCRDPDAALIQCVEVANIICTLKGISSVGLKLVQPEVAVFRALGMGPQDIRVLANDLDGCLRQHERLFEML